MSRVRPLFRVVAVLLVAAVAAGCGMKKRDPDFYVWRKAGWDPKVEDTDYAACYERAKKSAYRKFYWRRSALSREVDNPTSGMTPGTIMNKLQEIAEDEKAATLGIVEDCMVELGYQYIPINQWAR